MTPGLKPPASEPGVPTAPRGSDHAPAGVLRVITCGSVDDGKSTLIGRLLHDAKAIHLDQLEAVRGASAARGQARLDLSLLTDGLRAEREQGITIDVAYRFFTTPRRRFILADTPGHAQYTRNMATGASTADAAIIVLDARNGVVEQTRRHACIAALLGVPRLFVCVNKMDLVGFDQARFEQIRRDFLAFAGAARPDGGLSVGERTVAAFLPISALDGDNVVERSARTTWFEGRPLLDQLEAAPDRPSLETARMRLPVQCVIRPPAGAHGGAEHARAYAGRLAAGVLGVGDSVTALPSGQRSVVVKVRVGWEEVERAAAPDSVSVVLADELDLARGDTLVGTANLADERLAPMVTRDIEATVVWMAPQPLVGGRRLLVKHACKTIPAVVRSLGDRLSVQTLALEPAGGELALNHIGRVVLRLAEPIVCDPYALCRDTGSFILIDEAGNNTLGAGMILPPAPRSPA